MFGVRENIFILVFVIYMYYFCKELFDFCKFSLVVVNYGSIIGIFLVIRKFIL